MSEYEELPFVGGCAFSGYGIEIHPVVPGDLPGLRRWRNDPEISSQMVDTSRITAQRQIGWYRSIITRRDQAHWTAYCKGVRTGYMNLKAGGILTNADTVDVGLYVGNSTVRHPLIGLALALIQQDIALNFLDASHTQIYLKRGNDRGIRFNETLGYKIEEEGDTLFRMRLNRRDFERSKKKFSRFLGDFSAQKITII